MAFPWFVGEAHTKHSHISSTVQNPGALPACAPPPQHHGHTTTGSYSCFQEASMAPTDTCVAAFSGISPTKTEAFPLFKLPMRADSLSSASVHGRRPCRPHLPEPRRKPAAWAVQRHWRRRPQFRPSTTPQPRHQPTACPKPTLNDRHAASRSPLCFQAQRASKWRAGGLTPPRPAGRAAAIRHAGMQGRPHASRKT